MALIAATMVPAQPVRQHIKALREAGVGLRSLQAATGLGYRRLDAIASGRTREIDRATRERILAVQRAHLPDATLVPSEGTVRNLELLASAGYPRRQVALRLGLADDWYIRPSHRHVRRHVADAVAALAAELVGPVAPAPRRSSVADLDTSWMTEGRCRGLPAHEAKALFFPLTETDTAAARRFCSDCPVRQQCIAYATAAGELGVWGGTTEQDRRRMSVAS